MTPKVMIHSDGMVSVDAEELKPSEASIEFVKGTALFDELVSLIGEKHALASVESGAPMLPADSVAQVASPEVPVESVATTED